MTAVLHAKEKRDKVEITLASRIDAEKARVQISRIFVEGFYEWIKFFSKDKSTLRQAFSHIFNLNVFYVALIGDEVAGFASVCDRNENNIKLNRKELQKHLGLVMGFFAYRVLRKEFEDKQYPFTFTDEMQPIEFVATSSAYQRSGVASQIIRSIFENDPHGCFVLEVADTNTKAVALYQKLGFEEMASIKMKNSKQSGIDHLLYMKYEKNKEGEMMG